MPIAALPIGFSPPVLIDPTPGEDVANPVFLEWETTTDEVVAGLPVHFWLQIADDVNFTTNVINAQSRGNQTNFQYEISPGTWAALPSTGLAEADLGKHVRYAPGLSTIRTYFWRVSTDQLI